MLASKTYEASFEQVTEVTATVGATTIISVSAEAENCIFATELP